MCPTCQSPRSVKNGSMHGLQRYKCKGCGCNYTRSYAHYQAKDGKRRLALILYIEGLSFHAIADLLGVSHVSVINWVKRYGRHLHKIRNPRPCRKMSSAESGLYAGRPLPAAGSGLTLIENTETTLIRLWGSDETIQENERNKEIQDDDRPKAVVRSLIPDSLLCKKA